MEHPGPGADGEGWAWRILPRGHRAAIRVAWRGVVWAPGPSAGPTGAELQWEGNEAAWVLGLRGASARSGAGGDLDPGPWFAPEPDIGMLALFLRCLELL